MRSGHSVCGQDLAPALEAPLYLRVAERADRASLAWSFEDRCGHFVVDVFAGLAERDVKALRLIVVGDAFDHRGWLNRQARMAVQRVCDWRVPYHAASRLLIAFKRVYFDKARRSGLNRLDFCAMVDDTPDSLREMALHRGLKLVRSRRRKPGRGDFGKFGLTDDQGKALLGVGDDGLTASAKDIAGYLRADAANTWQQSAKITPDRPAARSEPERDDTDVEEARPRRFTRGTSEAGDSGKSSKSSSSRSSHEAVQESERKPTLSSRRRESPVPRKEANRNPKHPKMMPASTKVKSPESEPALVLRAATPADAGAIVKLLGQLGGIDARNDYVAGDIAALRKKGAGVHVAAELASVVGCIGWAVVPTLQHAPVGRITVVVVDEDHRRRGIGAQLLAEAEAALAKKGCTLIEAMSDIEMRNSHNFFRSLKFDQVSYGFSRKITP